MAVNFLPLDDVLLTQSDTWAQDKETFQKVVQHYLDTKYVGNDSAAVYALFNPAQRKLLDRFFRGFSVEAYRELNGVVELQVQARDAKVRERIKGLEEAMGLPFNTEDWVYDGMVDSGKDSGVRCDLCPRPIRYAHFAVNKKTHDCLRFGCSCAGDFFNIDKNALGSLRTIQANTLKDIKMIAFVIENKQLEGYYRYLCGKTGQIMLEDGIAGLLKVLAFEVDASILKEDQSDKAFNDLRVRCHFASGAIEERTVSWVKENIILCTNVDLDDNYGALLEDRKLIPLKLDGKDVKSLDVHPYLGIAAEFEKVGLPLPLSLCKRINKALSVGSSVHHVDYISFAKELLISRNLKDSAVLIRAFSDFIGNYYASVNTGYPRDPELVLWGIRGPKTFYNTVLQWESIYRVLKMCWGVVPFFTQYPCMNYPTYRFGVNASNRGFSDLMRAREYFMVGDPDAVTVDTSAPKYLVHGLKMPVDPAVATEVYFSLYTTVVAKIRDLFNTTILMTFKNIPRSYMDKDTASGIVDGLTTEKRLEHMISLCASLVGSYGATLDKVKFRQVVKDTPDAEAKLLALFEQHMRVGIAVTKLGDRLYALGKVYWIARTKSDRIQNFERISAVSGGDSLEAILKDFDKLFVPGRLKRLEKFNQLGQADFVSLLSGDLDWLDALYQAYLGDTSFGMKYGEGDSVNQTAFRDVVKKLEAGSKVGSDATSKVEPKPTVNTSVVTHSRAESAAYKRFYTLVNDRIGFFTCDVDQWRKDHPNEKKTEGMIRRACMKEVKYLRSNDEAALFRSELEKPLPAGIQLSDAAKTLLKEFEKAGKADSCITEGLRTECYNDGLIFTAIGTFHDALDLLCTAKFQEWLKDPKYASLLSEGADTIHLYYVMRSGLLKLLRGLLEVAIDYDDASKCAEVKALIAKVEAGALPKEASSVQEVIDSYEAARKPDAQGLTGVDKAQMVVDSPDKGKLQTFKLDICTTVAQRKTCSPKQFVYVNQAFTELGLDKKVKPVAPAAVPAPDAPKVSKGTKKADKVSASDAPVVSSDSGVSTFDADVAKAKEMNAKVKAAKVQPKDPSKITVRFVNQCKKVVKSDGFWGLDMNVREGIKIVADGGLLDEDTLAKVRQAVDSF